MHRLLLVLVLFAFMAPGCSGTHSPRLTVTSAALTDRTDTGYVVTLTVEADNVNPDAVPLRDVNYDVWIAGKQVFSGVRSPEATVRRFGTETFTLPVAVAGQAPEGTVPYAIRGTIKYLVPGALAETLFDIHVLRPSTEFRGDGVVDLSTLQKPQQHAARQ